MKKFNFNTKIAFESIGNAQVCSDEIILADASAKFFHCWEMEMNFSSLKNKNILIAGVKGNP